LAAPNKGRRRRARSAAKRRQLGDGRPCTTKALFTVATNSRNRASFAIAGPRDWCIDLRDFDRLIDSKTKLVALSAVSTVNGFQHDLKAVCDLANSRGSLAYADAVKAVGAVPVNVRELYNDQSDIDKLLAALS